MRMALLFRGGFLVVVLLLAARVREAAARAGAGGGPSSWHHQGVSAYMSFLCSAQQGKKGKGRVASQVMTDTDLTNRLNNLRDVPIMY